jgi:hypothetical protein
MNTLLEIVTSACDEMGLPRPGSSGVFASSVPQDRQMVGLMQAIGRDLMASHEWSALITTASITVASASATYALPTDFDRMVVDTGWDRTNSFMMQGNISPQKHQWWLSADVTAPNTHKEFRVKLLPGSVTVHIHPTPSASESLHFLYVRNTWAVSAGSNVAKYATDSDTTVFKPQLMLKELKWRFRSAKGLDSDALFAERTMLYNALVAADLGTGMMDMTGVPRLDPLEYLNIPDSNWNL